MWAAARFGNGNVCVFICLFFGCLFICLISIRTVRTPPTVCVNDNDAAERWIDTDKQASKLQELCLQSRCGAKTHSTHFWCCFANHSSNISTQQPSSFSLVCMPTKWIAIPSPSLVPTIPTTTTVTSCDKGTKIFRILNCHCLQTVFFCKFQCQQWRSHPIQIWYIFSSIIR